MKKRNRIVIADDNRELCEILAAVLEEEGFNVSYVHDGLALIAHLKENKDIDLVILDLIMPERGGTSVFETIRTISPASRIIIYTGYTDYRSSVFGRNADAFINKADGAEKLIEAIKQALK